MGRREKDFKKKDRMRPQSLFLHVFSGERWSVPDGGLPVVRKAPNRFPAAFWVFGSDSDGSRRPTLGETLLKNPTPGGEDGWTAYAGIRNKRKEALCGFLWECFTFNTHDLLKYACGRKGGEKARAATPVTSCDWSVYTT